MMVLDRGSDFSIVASSGTDWVQSLGFRVLGFGFRSCERITPVPPSQGLGFRILS